MQKLLIAICAAASLGLLAAFAADRPAFDYDRATVMVSDEEGHGSGVFIAPHLVLTAAHVVSDSKDGTATVTDFDGNKPLAKVLWIDKERDLAVLGLGSYTAPVVAPVSCQEPLVGDRVQVVGNPLNGSWVHSWGRVAGRRITHENGGGRTVFLTDAAATWGNSGGPVFDSDGRVIGILVELFARNFGFSITASGWSIAVTGRTLCDALAGPRELQAFSFASAS